MRDTQPIQQFLSRLFRDSGPFNSVEEKREDDTETSINVTLTRTVDNVLGVTKTVVTNVGLNADVPSNATTDQFETPQAFVDAVLAFIADPANEISVTEGVITNDRP